MVDYEDFLYSDFPHQETHPDRLATLSTLFGLSPAPPDRCRVLELGCGLGGNLIGLAVALPGSTFVGIDLSARQVAAGQEVISTLTLPNIELRAQDILDYAAHAGTGASGDGLFDYILCHGIYSWVPEPVQAAILHIMRRSLTQNGVGYISYNTLPGWHMRGMVRDLLRREAGEGTHTERLARARAFLSFLEHTPEQRSPAHAFLLSEVRLLGQLADEYLFYEHLCNENRPVYFRDFAAAAAAADLAYLGDAHQQSTLKTRMGEEALAALPSDDLIEQEQHLDHLDVRFFRRTLLCRKETKVVRDPGPAQLRTLFVSSWLTPEAEAADVHSEEPETFRGPGERGVSVHEPLLKAALWLLTERAPRGAPFLDLCTAAWAWVTGEKPEQAPLVAQEQLAGSVLDLVARGFAHLGLGVPAFVSLPGPFPETTSLVRLQATRGQSGCVNLRHESVEVDDLDRALLRRLDGTRGMEELLAAVLSDIAAEHYELQRLDDDNEKPLDDPGEIREIVEQRLRRLARSGFLQK